MEISFKNGMYYLTGRLDEHATFESLAKAPDPLKLNMAKVQSINSVGVRRFLAFTLGWSPKTFEFHECTPEFIVNVNVIPQLIGSPADPKAIKSLFVPYSCETCKRVENVLFERSSIRLDANGEVDLPARKCEKCGGAMDLDVEKNDFFLFLADAG